MGFTFDYTTTKEGRNWGGQAKARSGAGKQGKVHDGYLAGDDEPAVVLGVVLGDLLEGEDLGRRHGAVRYCYCNCLEVAGGSGGGGREGGSGLRVSSRRGWVGGGGSFGSNDDASDTQQGGRAAGPTSHCPSGSPTPPPPPASDRLRPPNLVDDRVLSWAHPRKLPGLLLLLLHLLPPPRAVAAGGWHASPETSSPPRPLTPLACRLGFRLLLNRRRRRRSTAAAPPRAASHSIPGNSIAAIPFPCLYLLCMYPASFQLNRVPRPLFGSTSSSPWR